MTFRMLSIVVLMMGLAAGTALAADDIAKAHPDKVTVEFENAKVRVMRVKLAPHEKMDLHEAGDLVNIPLTDYTVVHTDKSGNAKEYPRAAGKPEWVPASERTVEAGDKPIEAILVEIKSPPSK